jgi:hypothetical protein
MEAVDAVAGRDLAGAHAMRSVDLVVGVAMRPAKPSCQLGPDRRLAAPHQPDQNEVSRMCHATDAIARKV